MSNLKNYEIVVEEFIYDYPVCEFYYITPSDLIFSDKVRIICEKECTNYGKSWACPPGIGAIEKCIEECNSFDHVFLFTSVAEVSDAMNFEACFEAKKAHELMTHEIRNDFKARFGKVLALSTGCMLCDECSCPAEPCRHPDERISTIESHGILIMETASRLGVTLDCGNQIVTYIGLIFFNTN